MPARRPLPIRSVQSLAFGDVDDPATKRALDAVGDAVRKMQTSRSRVQLTADLAIGINRISHGLGREAFGFMVTPTVASATYAVALVTSGNGHPELEVWINVIGAAQPGARIEVF